MAYVYHLVGCATGSNGKYCSYKTNVVRYRYSFSDGKLTWMDDVISGLDGSNDHNSGRIKISPLPEADGNYHLYYTIGDMGAGNLANVDRPNHAQDTTVIEGKVLRLNTEPDPSQASGPQQWIPGDNPFPAAAPLRPLPPLRLPRPKAPSIHLGTAIRRGSISDRSTAVPPISYTAANMVTSRTMR